MSELKYDTYRSYKKKIEECINVINNSSDVDHRLRYARTGVETLEKMRPHIKKGEITLDQDVDKAIESFKKVNDEIITEYLEQNYSDIVEQDMNGKTDGAFTHTLENLLTDTTYYRLLTFDNTKIQGFKKGLENGFKALNLPRLSNPQFSLLREFKFKGRPDDYISSERWQRVLKKPESIIKFFEQEDLVRSSTLIETIDSNFSKVEIQEVLRVHNEPVSGLKDELIKRALKIDEDIFKNKLEKQSSFKCTEKGLKLVKCYENYQQQLQRKVNNEILQLLENRQFERCLGLRKKFENEKVFPSPPGMSTWSAFIPNTQEQLQLIFSKSPTILKELSNEKLENLRLGAGFMVIWGTSRPEKNLVSINFDIGYDFSVACRMLLFHASYLRDLARYKASNVVKKVEIIASSDSCDNCKKIDGREFKLDKVPELPYPKCTCEFGCRCTIAAVT